MGTKERYSDIITLLRFPLILMLVFTHFDISSAGIIHSYGGVYDVKLPLLADIIVFSFGHLFGGVWVASFFLMSGYLFFLNFMPTADCYKNKLKRRKTSLLIPYMVWNVIWAVYETGSAYVRYLVTGEFVFFQDDADTSVWHLLYVIFWGRPACCPFWFVRDLMVLTLLSPVLYRLLKYKLLFYVIMILWILPFFHSFTIVEGGLGALAFFMLGGAISMKHIDVFTWMRSKIVPILFCVVAIWDVAYRGGIYYQYLHTLTILTAMAAIFYLADKCVCKGLMMPDFLVHASFFFFAAHQLFIGPFTQLYSYFLLPNTGQNQFLIWIGVTISTTSFCLIICYAVQTYMPTVYKVLTGRR